MKSFKIKAFALPPHPDTPERSGRLAKKAEKLSERSEFFSARQTSAQRREPAIAEGYGGRVRLGALSLPPFFGQTKKGGRRPGAKPRNADSPKKARSLGRDILQLTRPRLSAAVAASAFAGFHLHPSPSGSAELPTAGVFLLAAGCSALNQLQERKTDALMERTRHRPLPAGRLTPGVALAAGALLAAAGLLLLAMAGQGPLAGGLAALVLYNALYTPMKRRTAFALLPGALCGALAPPIGWMAAGGDVADPRVILPAACLFLWQIPHFWLLADRRREDYRRAALPVPLAFCGRRQGARLAAVWLLCLALLAGFLFVAAPGLSPAARIGGTACALYIARLSFGLGRNPDPAPPLLPRVNLSMAGLALCLLLPGG